MNTKNMKCILLLVSLYFRLSDSGSPCPSWERINPCFCSTFNDGGTVFICPEIQNTFEMEQVTKPLKSMILDRLLLLNIFMDENISDPTGNLLEPKTNIPLTGVLPKKWLAEVRVRELEIQNGQLHSCFLCDDALEGQNDFLTSLVVKNAKLTGHLSSTTSFGTSLSVSTKELKRVSLLQHVDFSHNNIEVINGNAFPSTLTNLSKISLSNNRISRIHDHAFANLPYLKELDLSRNQLTTISRKIFKTSDISLKVIDLSIFTSGITVEICNLMSSSASNLFSHFVFVTPYKEKDFSHTYNSIQSLPDDMFSALSALREIKLSHNLLEVLGSTTWTRVPSLLEKIDLRGNFLICNCSMNWIPRRLSKSTKLIGECIGPREVEFQELKASLPTITTC